MSRELSFFRSAWKSAAVVLAVVSVCLGQQPATFEVRKNEARAFLEQRNYAAALERSKQLNREWPDDVATYQLMAAAQLELGDYADAEKNIQWMLDLKIGKADSAGWRLVAQFREVTGDLDGAIEAVNQAYSRIRPGQSPDASALLTYLAELHLLAGRTELAERSVQQALELAPKNPAALEILVRTRVAQERRVEAVQILHDLPALTIQPRHLYLLAELTRDPADYARFERAAIKQIASTDNANRELVLYYAGPGNKPAQALEMARAEVQHRHDVLTMDALAVALLANGQPDEARRIMRETLAVGTRDPEILKHAAAHL